MLSKIKDRTIVKLYNLLLNYHEKIKEKKIYDLPFSKKGKKVRIGKYYSILNPQFMEIGENFRVRTRLRLDAFDEYHGQKFSPKIEIGENANWNDDVHIACINEIKIGKNSLFASRIYIADHSHGEITKEELPIRPELRPLFSKGAVIIGDNVWIGEGVSILPNVKIGNNCVVGANSVVTKDFPDNCVIAGIPAKIIKQL